MDLDMSSFSLELMAASGRMKTVNELTSDLY